MSTVYSNEIHRIFQYGCQMVLRGNNVQYKTYQNVNQCAGFTESGEYIRHYLDDWIILGHREQCTHLLEQFLKFCTYLHVPVAEEKTVPPSTTIHFFRLPADKVVRLKQVAVECCSLCWVF